MFKVMVTQNNRNKFWLISAKMEFIKGDWRANRIKGRTVNQILERATQFWGFKGQELRKSLFKTLTPMRLNFKFSVLSHSA